MPGEDNGDGDGGDDLNDDDDGDDDGYNDDNDDHDHDYFSEGSVFHICSICVKTFGKVDHYKSSEKLFVFK